MREIKFRAWDKKRKIMIGSSYPQNWGDEKDEWWADMALIELVGIENINKRARWEVMQFTGLKDKNGKEIYEGDIVEHKYHSTLTILKWDDKKAQYNLGGYWPENIEVIGNIYEHPELLTK